jgi:serine/threonine protein kinase
MAPQRPHSAESGAAAGSTLQPQSSFGSMLSPASLTPLAIAAPGGRAGHGIAPRPHTGPVGGSAGGGTASVADDAARRASVTGGVESRPVSGSTAASPSSFYRPAGSSLPPVTPGGRSIGGNSTGNGPHASPHLTSCQSTFMPLYTASSLPEALPDGSGAAGSGASGGHERFTARHLGVAEPAPSVPNPWNAAQLMQALDEFATSGGHLVFLSRYALLGPTARTRGAQGVTQHAKGLHDGRHYALKFYSRRAAFDREQELYSRRALRALMPSVVEVVPNDDGAVASPSGWTMPPVIVFERGETLAEWARRAQPTHAAALAALCHVAARLQVLHDEGVAHRELRAASVLWRPKQRAWALADFGSSASIGAPSLLLMLRPQSALRKLPPFPHPPRTGLLPPLSVEFLALRRILVSTHSPTALTPGTTAAGAATGSCTARAGSLAPLKLSLAHAPPEAVHAYEAGEAATVVDPAADIWALGLIAFELLSGRRVFPTGMRPDDARDQIAGRAPLPWEDRALRPRNVPELGHLSRSVLGCLSRDAASRPSAREVLRAWDRLFSAKHS